MPNTLNSQDITYCVELLRNNASDLYLADLLLPKEIQPSLTVLHAFQVEIGKIADAVQDPAMGEIRLQWWSEVINGERRDEAQGNPVARALLNVIEAHNLPLAAFENKLLAHQFDLYHDPMGPLGMLQGYLGETRSIMFQLSGLVAGGRDIDGLADASGHAGVACGLVWLIESIGAHRKQGRIYAPCDLMEKVGLEPQTFLAEPLGRAHDQLVLLLAELAYDHQSQFQEAANHLPKNMAPIFNQTALLPLYLKRAVKRPRAKFEAKGLVSQIKRQWALWRY